MEEIFQDLKKLERYLPCNLPVDTWSHLVRLWWQNVFGIEDVPQSLLDETLQTSIRLSNATHRCQLNFCPIFKKCLYSNTTIVWGNVFGRSSNTETTSIKPSTLTEGLKLDESVDFIVISADEVPSPEKDD